MSVIIYGVALIIAIVWNVVSIMTCIHRNEIKEKYDIGYISSGLMTTCVVMPITFGIPAMLLSESEERFIAVIMSFVYAIGAFFVYMAVAKGDTVTTKMKRFFLMLAVGVSLWAIIPVEAISLFLKHCEHSCCSSYSGSYGDSYNYSDSNTKTNTSFQNKTFTDEWRRTSGFMNENGYLTDAYGKHIGNVYADGRITNEMGSVIGYWNKDGHYITDYSGHIVGYFDENGRVSNYDGSTKGYFM